MKKALTLTLLLVGCVWPVGSASSPPVVSMLQLIANPEKYNGKPVSLIGFMHVGFESDIVYLNYEDYRHGILENGLWFERTTEITKNELLDMNYVMLSGTFVARPISYSRFSAGGVTNVTRASPWSELKHPIAEKSGLRDPKN